MQLSGFDATTVEPNTPFEPVPAGKYTAIITESEEKPTKAMTGSYLQMTVEIVDGAHKGKKVFERLNLKNPNATAVDIANRTLSAICRATGVMTPSNSNDLHNKPFTVTIAVKPADGQYSASNEIKGYEPAGQATPSAPADAGASGKPPWMT
jgi:hypothetical protein